MSIATAPNLRQATRHWLRPHGIGDSLAIFALIALVAGVQFVSGAYRGDFAADADEPGHVVSSLLIHDYIAGGLTRHPTLFAQQYYVHYPKVAIGHWPPLMYASEAVWMLAFGRTRAAMLALITAADLALLLSVFLWVRRDCGALAGFLAAAALAAPRFMQVAMSSVAPGIFLALLAFWAAIAYGSFLETKRWRDAIWFAILALAAAGVHGRGAMLVLLPVVAPLISPGIQRRARLRQAAILIAVMIALAFGPRIFHQVFYPNLRDTMRNCWTYVATLITTMSGPVALLALVGGWRAVRSTHARWIAIAAAVLSGWVFHTAVNVHFEAHYLVTVAPAVAALAGGGIYQLMQGLASGIWRRSAAAALVAAIAVGITALALPLWRKPDPGYHRMAEGLIPNGISMVAGTAIEEGSFITEIALRDRLREHVVLRGSKMLSVQDWNDWHYQDLFHDSRPIPGYLDRLHVATVIVAEPYVRPHVVQLLEAVTGRPLEWREIPSGLPAVRIFRRIGALPAGPVHLRIPVGGGYFELDW